MNLRFLSYSVGIVALTLLGPSVLHAAEVVQPNLVIASFADRISWSAILAGLVVALALHMAFSTLGIGVGAASIDAFDRKNPAKGIPTMLFVWMFASGLIALFVGGWVAGWSSGTTPTDSAIHGVIAWAMATVVTLLLGMTSVGYAVGGMFRILGEGVSAGAKTAAAVVPNAAQMATDLIGENVPSINWKSIKRDAEKLLSEVGEEAKELAAVGAGNSEGEHKKNGQRNRTKSNFEREDVLELVEKSYGVVRDGLSNEDRDGLKDALMSRMGVSEEDTEKTLKKWESSYAEAKQQYQRLSSQAEQTARDSADVATRAISQIAVWTFASLTFGMMIAGLGGYLGSPSVDLDSQTMSTIQRNPAGSTVLRSNDGS